MFRMSFVPVLLDVPKGIIFQLELFDKKKQHLAPIFSANDLLTFYLYIFSQFRGFREACQRRQRKSAEGADEAACSDDEETETEVRGGGRGHSFRLLLYIFSNFLTISPRPGQSEFYSFIPSFPFFSAVLYAPISIYRRMTTSWWSTGRGRRGGGGGGGRPRSWCRSSSPRRGCESYKYIYIHKNNYDKQ